MNLPRIALGQLVPVGLLVLPCAAQSIPEVWNRQAEWIDQPASAQGTTMGNPSPDPQGHLVWNYAYASGGGLGSANPWYDEPRTPMTWDDSWFGGDGVWSSTNDDGCLTRRSRSTHVLTSGDFDLVPVTSWRNATTQDLDVFVGGTIRVAWSGLGGNASQTDVDVVVLHRSGATGASTLLFSQTVSKPSPTSTAESRWLAIEIPALHVARGDEVAWTLRGRTPSNTAHWMDLVDELRILRTDLGAAYCGPSAANSTGLSSSLAGYGSPLASDNRVTLLALHVPNHSFGYFLTSRTQGFVANPAGSQGNLCLSGSIGRFVGPGQIQNSGNSHIVPFSVDLTQMPSPSAGLVAAQAGESWSFQYWFRDVGSTSNFTSGLGLTLQ